MPEAGEWGACVQWAQSFSFVRKTLVKMRGPLVAPKHKSNTTELWCLNIAKMINAMCILTQKSKTKIKTIANLLAKDSESTVE